MRCQILLVRAMQDVSNQEKSPVSRGIFLCKVEKRSNIQPPIDIKIFIKQFLC